MSKNSALIQSSLGKTQTKQNLQNWDTKRLVGESDSQNSKNHGFIMQIFCQNPLFYLWPSSSLCLLLTLKLLRIHAWLFSWDQRSSSAHGTHGGQQCLACQINKEQTKSIEQCCSYPELPKALPPPTQSSLVRTTATTTTHDFTGLVNCMTRDEALNSNHTKAPWLSVCGTKRFHAQNLITDRNSQAAQPQTTILYPMPWLQQKVPHCAV